MKERGDELTNQANSFSLEGRGGIMPDGGTPEQPEPNLSPEISGDALASSNNSVARLEELAGEGSGERIREEQKKSQRKFLESQESDRLPRSFEDLVGKIMNSAEAQWKEDGDQALIDKEGNINKENFLAWVRDRMMWLHDFNSVTETSFFSDVHITVGYAKITLYDMIFTGKYFLHEVKGNDGNISYHKSDDLEKLKDQLINEAFLFGNSRNNDVKYKSMMPNEAELPKLLQQIYFANPFLRGSNFQDILTLNSVDKNRIQQLRDESGNVAEFDKNRIKNLVEKDSSVGEGVRRALLAYYHIRDIEMLKKIFEVEEGKKIQNLALFMEGYDDYDSKTLRLAVDENGANKPKKKGEANQDLKDTEAAENIPDGEKTSVEYDSDGKVKLDTKAQIKRFTDYMNPFNLARKEERQEGEIRERIRQSIMQVTGLTYSEAKYAESWAYSMARWTGIGARNDTGAAAFDAWSKPQNLLPYRLKQLEDKRLGVFGNKFNLAGIKRAGLTMFEGISDIHGRNIIEAIQGGQGMEFNADNPFKTTDAKTNLAFGKDTGSFFVSNHVMNSFKIYDFIINHTDFNIEDMITYDTFGRPIIDHEKADKIIDGIQKAIRYAYCTWDGINYNKSIRVMEKDVDGNDEIKEMPLIAAMFGPDILKMIQNDISEREARLKPGESLTRGVRTNIWTIAPDHDNFQMDMEKVQSKAVREVLWKSILQYLIAEEVHSHRSRASEETRYGYDMVEKVYDFLRRKGIADKAEIDEMRKLSNSTLRVLNIEDFVMEAGKGTLKGFWSMMRIIMSGLMTGK